MKYLIMAFVIMLSSVSLWSQVTADLEYRVNPVYSRGFREPLYQGDKAGFYTMQRTRLILNYTAEGDLKAEVVLQDRRFWGEDNANADVPSLAVFRAWVEKYFSPSISLKLGRQGLIYDDQYLFGERNWGGTLAHDVALLKYESSFGKIHLGGAYNSDDGELKRQHYEAKDYKAIQFAWMHKDFGPVTSSLIFINQGEESADTVIHYQQTFGTNTSWKITDNLSLKGIYYHQLGKNTSEQTVNAYLLSIQSVLKVNDALTFHLGADISSGTSEAHMNDPAYSTNTTFHRNFGLIHAQFGYLDYFFVNNPTDQGLKDFYLKVKGKLNKLTLNNHIHSFYSDKTILNTDGEPMDDFLGVENDLLVDYKFSDTFSASLGHSIMFGSATLDDFFGGTPIKESQFVYAVITAKPRLFTIQK